MRPACQYPCGGIFYKKFGAALFTYLGTYYIMIVDEQRQMHFDAPEKHKYVKNVK